MPCIRLLVAMFVTSFPPSLPLSPDSPSPDILERLQRESHTHQPMVDVYLGKEILRTNVNSMPHAMLNGWLGSIPHQNGMTYSDLLHLVRKHIPVS